MEFKLQSEFKPSGDQPQAIEALVNGVEEKQKHQVLLGCMTCAVLSSLIV